MINLSLEEIVKAVDGYVYKAGSKDSYKSISIDTRKDLKDAIFIAIKGERFNGNEFAKEAIKKGSAVCIVDEIKFDESDVGDASVIKVEDTKQALKDLAKYYRAKLNIKVIGVTGSTGKTTTKDLIAAALSSKFKVFKTKGNFNNEIGLPLMIFDLDHSYDVAVLEMGMSNFNEIHRLADVAHPDIAVITNIGISHIENLGCRENILKAKLEIADFFNSSSNLVVNAEDDLLMTVNSSNYKVIKIGYNNNFDYFAEKVTLFEDRLEYNINDRKDEKRILINLPGKHNVLNSLLAISCGKLLGLNYEEIAEGLDNLEATSMRLDIVKKEKFTIIDDCYNASPDSVKAALDVQNNINGKRKIAVLGTMRELGEESYKAHKEIGSYAREKDIDILIVISEYSDAFKEGYNEHKKFLVFKSNDEAVNYLQAAIEEGDVILVKASRSMKFESIVNKLKNINC